MSKYVTLHGFSSNDSIDTSDATATAHDIVIGKTAYVNSEKLIGTYEGVELNFEVVGGTTQPENPKENTIWVNTDSEITSWVFSAQQPTSPTTGMVWFATVNDSMYTFNTLKENVIKICIINAKQYISGTFTNIEINFYQQGQWVPVWNGYIFKNGENWVNGFTTNANGGTATIGSTIYLSRNRVDGTSSVRSKKPVYVNDYSSLKFTISSCSKGSYGTSYTEAHTVLGVSLVDSETNSSVASLSLNGNNLGTGTFSIPVTAPCNVYISIGAYTYGIYGYMTISISDIHFE